MSRIKFYSRNGVPEYLDAQAEVAKRFGSSTDDYPHGMTPAQIDAFAEKSERMLRQAGIVNEDPRLYSHSSSALREFEKLLPKGASIDRRHAQMVPSGGPGGAPNATFSTQVPYLPEFSSPDRASFPIYRRIANCFVAGTPVIMADGSPKAIEDVRVGDKVLDRMGKTAVVEHAWEEKPPAQLVTIEVEGGKEFTCTLNHKWPVWAWLRSCHCGCGIPVKPGKCWANKHNPKRGDKVKKLIRFNAPTAGIKGIPQGYDPIQKLNAVDLRPGDLLMSPRKFDEERVDITPEKARLLGYYIAEGCGTKKDSRTVWILHKKELNTLAKDIRELCAKAGVETSMRSTVCENSIRIETSGIGNKKEKQELQSWFIKHGGAYSHTKKMSHAVMHSSLTIQLEVLRGLFRGDGHQKWRKQTIRGKTIQSFRFEYVTVSPILASQVQLILTRLGFNSRRYTRKAFFSEKIGYNQREAYFIGLSGEPARKLASLIWGENSNGHEYEAKNIHRGTMFDDDFAYSKIKKVSVFENREKKPVYNLSVSGDHTYLVANIATQNSYWQLFYKMDPIIGAVTEMKSILPWSDFQLTGEHVDGDIKDTYEYATQECNIRNALPKITAQYEVLGEVIPHLFYDDNKGIFNHLTMHNPDQINVVYSPFLKMDPILEFVPDPKLREIVASNDPMLAKLREVMPPALVGQIRAGQNVRLNPVTTSFIARKLNDWDLRGTSIISRLWRTLMAEDALWNALIQTARRAANPVKVLLMGDPQTGQIPTPATEEKLINMLQLAENDVQCFTPETLVTLGDGTRTPIGNLNIGDVVIDMHGTPSEVQALAIEQANKLIKIKCVGMDAIECTETHKFPMMQRKVKLVTVSPKKRQSQHVFTPFAKVPASQLVKRDFLLIPRKFKEKRPENVTLEHARLLGYYAAEGSMRLLYTRKDGSTRWGFQLSFHIKENETLRADVDAILTKICGTVSNVQLRPADNSMQVLANKNASSDLALWLKKHAGEYAHTKKLSTEVMQWPLDLKYEFLRGYIAGDGYRGNKKGSSSNYIEINSVSIDLMHQVQLMIAQLGYLAHLTHRVQPLKSYGAGNTIHRLHINGELSKKLCKDIWNIEFEISRTANKRWFAQEHFLYVAIDKIEELQKNSPVINMTVKGDHSYVAGGIATWNSWVATNYMVKFEQWGAPDRVMNITQHHEMIDNVKMVALGVSRAFLSGEQSYSSAASGLTIFLQRLKAHRDMIQKEWLIPKFYLPMARMNDWVKPSNASKISGGHVRVKRSSEELEDARNYIIPTIVWEKSLDSNVDKERIDAMSVLAGTLGIKMSDQTIFSTIGLDAEEEQTKITKELKWKRELAGKDPALQAAFGLAQAGGGDEGGGGGGGLSGGGTVSPGIPPEAMGFGEGQPGGGEGGEGGDIPEGAPGGETPAPEGASLSADKGEKPKPVASDKFETPNWRQRTVKPLLNLFNDFDMEAIKDSDAEPWIHMLKDKDVQSALKSRNPEELWSSVKYFLIDEGYPDKHVDELKDLLTAHKKIAKASKPNLSEMLEIYGIDPDASLF